MPDKVASLSFIHFYFRAKGNVNVPALDRISRLN